MLPLLLLPLYWWNVDGASWGSSHTATHREDASRPHIYYCRSPSMETFTCWWHPLDNGPQGDNDVTYSLEYTIGNRPPVECPDYVTGGANSCYFDTEHTMIWEVYCMNVTAHSSRGSFTSDEHCLDVAEIVEIDPPFNLTYTLMNISEDESGRTALVSWQYPIAQQVNIGWITLIYELRFRAMSEPSVWKVKERLREPHFELLDLPAGSYEVQVHCRSKNNNLWSKWSSPLTIVIPPRNLPGTPPPRSHKHMNGITYTTACLSLSDGSNDQDSAELANVHYISVSSIIVTVMLIVGFGIVPQSKRIKAFLLPPVPKPCIRGIDPMLLKKGKMEEINRHFFSLYGYKAPRYYAESLLQVNIDESLSLAPLSPTPSIKDEEPPSPQSSTSPEHQQLLQTPDSPSPYCQNPPCSNKEVSVAPKSPNSHTWAWPAKSPTPPELVSFPGMDYSMILNPAPASTSIPQDFYTCVQGVTDGEMVHLVPCVPKPVIGSPYCELKKESEEDPEKSRQF
ncbi:prolactin receptor-like [Trichomycterus rosablanca]|uniref:prolactin receptor-like n=1 Tax=Trichomycterus rosablanca TaxID=2290929 RepID=UPI002F35467B